MPVVKKHAGVIYALHILKPSKNQLFYSVSDTMLRFLWGDKGMVKFAFILNIQSNGHAVAEQSRSHTNHLKENLWLKEYENQFKDLYSLGETPTLLLNSLVKCCGYLKPKL